jgi:hypothetical protein
VRNGACLPCWRYRRSPRPALLRDVLSVPRAGRIQRDLSRPLRTWWHVHRAGRPEAVRSDLQEGFLRGITIDDEVAEGGKVVARLDRDRHPQRSIDGASRRPASMRPSPALASTVTKPARSSRPGPATTRLGCSCSWAWSHPWLPPQLQLIPFLRGGQEAASHKLRTVDSGRQPLVQVPTSPGRFAPRCCRP